MTPDPWTAVADGARHAVYAELAAAGPVHRVRLPAGIDGWLITGREAARTALTHPHVVKGGGERGGGPFQDVLPPELTAAAYRHMLSADPPDHTRLRRLVSAAFTRRRSESLAPRVEQLTAMLLDDLAGGGDGPVELIAAFAYPLPIAVICELLGVPAADQPRFRAWTTPLVAGTLAGLDAYSVALYELVTYTRGLLAAKRADPADDLLSALVAIRDDGDRLTEHELTSMVYLLLLAGHETTVNLIGNGICALLSHPDQLALLRSEPHRLDAAVEELLRYDGPVQSTIPAVTTAPVELGGVRIPAGAIVTVALLAANREVGGDGDGHRLDITRADPGQLAFGHGIHHCLGAPLARLEARVAIGGLLARFPRLRLAVPPAELLRTPGFLMNGLAELPVLLR